MYAQVAPSEEDAIELQTLSKTAETTVDGSCDENEKDGILSPSIVDTDNASERQLQQLQLYRLCNVAVPLNYFLVGLVQGLAYPLLNVYPLDLGALEAQQTTLLTLKTLPSCFKLLFGIMSDNLPLGGLRRKPYLYIGWFLSSLSLVPLLLFSDLSLVTNDDYFEKDEHHNYTMMNPTIKNTHQRIAPSDAAPSMPFLSVCFFLWANGVWMADVMGDALVAERAKYESTRNRGNTQAICYILRGFGFVLVAPLTSMVYSAGQQGPFFIILTTCLLPLLHVPALIALQEVPPQLLFSARDQLRALYKTACSPAVWQPMGYIFFALSCFVTNSAWKQFLETCLHFQPNQLNALMIVAGVMAFGGVILYKLLLYRMSWRSLYVWTISVNAIVSGMQLLLIFGTTFGLPPFAFALGDESMKDFVFGVQYLPMVIMMVHLVPTGIEGAAYALFTTTYNVAQSLADSVSTMLLGIWDVSKPTLASGDWSGLTRLTILTTVLQTLPILAVGLLPHSVEDLQRIQDDDDDDKSQSGKKYGGVTYLSLVSFALAWTIFVDVMNIVRPGWMGES